MRIPISKVVCLSVVLAAIASGTRGRAGVIHATANVKLNGFNETEFGEASAAVHGSYSDATDFQSGTATAQGMPGVSGVLVTGSSSSTFTSGVPVQTTAEWKDTVILSGPSGATLPDFVDLVFHTDGHIAFTGPSGVGMIQVAGFGFNSTYTFGSGLDRVDGPGTWDQLQFGGGSFSGVWHDRISLGLPDAFGNRVGNWRVAYSTLLNPAASSDSLGEVNGGDPPTFSFDAVRLADGRTPEEAGLSLTFESGITSPNSQSVPEPSSIVMLASGAIGLLGCGWRRRQRTNA